MAVDMKALFANALLDLCEQKHLRDISINDLSKKTGASKTTFYNHFRDKNDLIQYIYTKRILAAWENYGFSEDEMSLRTEFYGSMIPYKHFLKLAFDLEGQNSLAEYAYSFCFKWYEREIKKHLTRDGALPGNLEYVCRFVSYGIVYTVIDWIQRGMKESPETMASYTALSMPECLRTLFS